MSETFDKFDFMINEEDEVMLLLYQRESSPHQARIEVDIENKSALLFRNEEDVIELNGIDNNVLDSLQDADKLLVCELSREEDEDGDNQIQYAYEADIEL